QEGIKASVFAVDRRISKEVWRTVLQFLYTGLVHCSFATEVPKMVELLRACAVYKLPTALLDLAQAARRPIGPSVAERYKSWMCRFCTGPEALFRQLPASSPALALEVFSITAGSSGEGLDVTSLREAAVLILLNSGAQVFMEVPADKLSAILEKLIVIAEQMIFRGPK
ncbi:unnamed protein product, partial [Effrenium voratum]